MENEAILNAVQADGSTKRKHLESIEKQTGKRPPQLKEVEIPVAGILIMDYFEKLNSGRQWTAEGHPRPLSHNDIYCWCQLTSTILTDYELNAIKRLDLVMLNMLHSNRKDQAGKRPLALKKKENTSNQPRNKHDRHCQNIIPSRQQSNKEVI